LAKWLANAAFMSYTTDKTMDELEIWNIFKNFNFETLKMASYVPVLG
jgi:hypothetical protein